MSKDITLEDLAQMIAEGFKEASDDRSELRKTLGTHTKLLQQLVKFDQVFDRLRIIETELGIDSREATRQS